MPTGEAPQQIRPKALGDYLEVMSKVAFQAGGGEGAAARGVGAVAEAVRGAASVRDGAMEAARRRDAVEAGRGGRG